MNKASRIYVAGHTGMAGSAILRRLTALGCSSTITATHQELDLCNQAAVADFFVAEQPEIVFLAAAKVGGIQANNQQPADFIGTNLIIQHNVIHQAWLNGCKKIVFLGSSCIYPKLATQPMREEYLLSGELEPTNEWYAIAKIAGIKQCQAYRRQYGFDAISLMPTNLYGPGDNFDLENSHVLPAMIRRFHEAKQSQAPSVSIWGSGRPKREFLHVDDLANAAVHLAEHYSAEQIINVGTGRDISIAELAKLIADIVGYDGKINLDPSKPDGTPRKLLDVSRATEAGWQAEISLSEGIRQTYAWYQQHEQEARR